MRPLALLPVLLALAACGGASFEEQVDEVMRQDEPYWSTVSCSDTDGDGEQDECLVEDEETGSRGRVPVVLIDGEVAQVWTWAVSSD